MNLFLLLGAVIGMPLLLVLYRSYEGYVVYRRAVKALGKDKVVYLNYPYKTFSSAFKTPVKNGMDSFPILNGVIRKNPDIKIIVTSSIEAVTYIVCDPEMIRKLTHEHNRNVGKSKVIIFFDGIEKGLSFAEGDAWKRSRAIISNIFHFELLKNREVLMHEIA